MSKSSMKIEEEFFLLIWLKIKQSLSITIIFKTINLKQNLTLQQQGSQTFIKVVANFCLQYQEIHLFEINKKIALKILLNNKQSSFVLLNQKLIMFKSFLQNAKYFLISSTLITSGIYGYCYYQAKKNQKQYLTAINSDNVKDASRLTNQSFGISWGFQADDTVMNSIDSGDLFFIKYECMQCLDPLQIINCYKLTIPLLDEEYHTVGIGYRDESGLNMYFNQFGQNKFMKYSQFVSLPYIKELMVQKTSKNIHQKLVKLLEQDKVFDQVQDQNKAKGQNDKKQPANIFSNALDTIKSFISPKQNTFTFINRILKSINLIQEDEQIHDIRQLLTNQKQVNIRTQTNRILRSL